MPLGRDVEAICAPGCSPSASEGRWCNRKGGAKRARIAIWNHLSEVSWHVLDANRVHRWPSTCAQGEQSPAALHAREHEPVGRWRSLLLSREEVVVLQAGRENQGDWTRRRRFLKRCCRRGKSMMLRSTSSCSFGRLTTFSKSWMEEKSKGPAESAFARRVHRWSRVCPHRENLY